MVHVYDENSAAGGEGASSSKKRGGGPKSDAGKLRARASAFHHGFRARLVFSDDMADAIAERKRMLADQFRPQTQYQHTLIADMALARVKLDRLEELLPASADRGVERALDFSDHDQKTLALNLAARLPKDPARFAHLLAGTKQGAALMIERWESLVRIARSIGRWDEPQCRLALDLLGVPCALHSGCAALAPPGDGEGLVALATGQIELLQSRIDDVLDNQNDQDQADVIAGVLTDADTKLLRRYESEARRNYNRAHAELLRVQAEAAAEAAREREEFLPRSVADFLKRASGAGAAAPPPGPEQTAAREDWEQSRRARVQARVAEMQAASRAAADAEIDTSAAGAATSTVRPDSPAEEAPQSGQGQGVPNWFFHRDVRRSAHREAGPSGE
jgi:hypothetical protein